MREESYNVRRFLVTHSQREKEGRSWKFGEWRRTHSPKISTAVTETMTATTSDVILDKKIGMASTATALANSSVTSNR